MSSFDHAQRRIRLGAWLGGAGLVAAGCNALFGVDELSYTGAVSTAPTAGGGGAVGGGVPGGFGGEGGVASCEPGSSESCYGGPPDTVGRGVCRAGTRQCSDAGDGWSACEGEQLPEPDSCGSPTDDDCDGNECFAVWSLRIGSAGPDWVEDIAVDGADNVLVVGGFSNTVGVGSHMLSSAGGTDAFVAKIAPDGSVAWANRYGDAASQDIKAVAADLDGNVVVTTGFSGSIDFGSGPLVSAGEGDIALAKLDPSGAVVWALRVGSAVAESARDAAVDAAGNVVIVGNGYGDLNFGGGSLNNGGGSDLFAAKFSASGTHLWSLMNENSSDQYATAVTSLPAGVSFVGGSFRNNLALGTCQHTSVGGEDAFVARIEQTGSCTWALRFGGTENQDVTALATDAAGNLLVIGSYVGAIDLGGGGLAQSTDGNEDAYVASFSATGEHRWSHGWSAPGQQRPDGVVVDGEGRIFVVGPFAGEVDFGGGVLASSGDDLFVVALDSEGGFLASKSFSVTEPPLAYGSVPAYWPRRAAAALGDGSLAVSGIFFGQATVGAEPWPSAGEADGFVARLR